MKKNLSILILVLFCFVANAQTEKINPEKKSFKITRQSMIQFKTQDSINPDYEILKGAKNDFVFEYNFNAAENPELSDDEFFQSMTFQVSTKGNKFEYKGDKIKQAKMLFHIGCFCPESGTYFIQNGNLKGKKMNAKTWRVTLDFTYYPRNSQYAEPVFKKLSANFIVSTK